MSDLQTRAEAFLALADNATPGVWEDGALMGRPTIFFARGNHTTPIAVIYDEAINADDNLPFVVAARNDAPGLVADLLAEVERLRGGLRDYVRKYHAWMHNGAFSSCEFCANRLAEFNTTQEADHAPNHP